MKPLSSWKDVRVGDNLILLSVEDSPLEGFAVGDQVKVIDFNHTGFHVYNLTRLLGEEKSAYEGFVYYSYQAARCNAQTNEEAVHLLKREW